MADTVDLYIAADGLVGRDGGPYLDQEERRIAEERRAVVEDREPDYDNPPATSGTVLVTASYLLDASTVNAPSLTGEQKAAHDQELVASIAESDASAITPHATLPAEAFTPVDESTSPEIPQDTPVPPEETPEQQPSEGEENPEQQPVEETPEEDPFAGTPAQQSH